MARPHLMELSLSHCAARTWHLAAGSLGGTDTDTKTHRLSWHRASSVSASSISADLRPASCLDDPR
jgi:hypothetical protein